MRTFSGIDEDDSSEFTVSTETISAIVPYILDGRDLVAVAIDNHTVQSYTREVSPHSLTPSRHAHPPTGHTRGSPGEMHTSDNIPLC